MKAAEKAREGGPTGRQRREKRKVREEGRKGGASLAETYDILVNAPKEKEERKSENARFTSARHTLLGFTCKRD